MRILIAAFILLLYTQNTIAQTAVVKGTISDTAEKKPLALAVVSLINKKDSTLSQFTRTDRQGFFQLSNVEPGSFRVLVTYPKFADYADDINVTAEPLDLGAISMTRQAQLLQAVIIRSAGAIRIKGDTTEFVADSFNVREGATVEELLKKTARLPG
jgi:hypothetical protein